MVPGGGDVKEDLPVRREPGGASAGGNARRVFSRAVSRGCVFSSQTIEQCMELLVPPVSYHLLFVLLE